MSLLHTPNKPLDDLACHYCPIFTDIYGDLWLKNKIMNQNRNYLQTKLMFQEVSAGTS